MKPVFLFINIPTIYWFITIYTYNLLIYLTYKYFQKGSQKGSDSLPCSQKVALYVRYIIKPKRAWNHVALLSGNWLHTSRNPDGSGTVGVRTMGWLDAGHRDNSPPQGLIRAAEPHPKPCHVPCQLCLSVHSTFLGTLTYYSPRTSLAPSALGSNATLFLKTPIKKDYSVKFGGRQ